MRGVVFMGNRELDLIELQDPEPDNGEVVVSIKASGMCGTDLIFYRASAPTTHDGQLLIQGHEPCGIIEAVGPGVPAHVASVGDRVMIHHYWGCGGCQECRSGWPQLCGNETPHVPTLNEHGAHADLFKIPAIQTMPLPDELSFMAGAAIGCGTGTAWGALVRLGSVAGKDVLVVGQGPVGQSVTMFAAALGGRVIAADVVPARLEKAREFGADVVINSADVGLLEAVNDATSGRGAAVVLETSGVTAAAAQALEAVATWGRLCYVGVNADVQFNTLNTLRRQLTLMTTWTLSTVEQMRCAQFAVEHQLPVDALFTHRWSLDQAAEAYAWFDHQADGKGVFVK